MQACLPSRQSEALFRALNLRGSLSTDLTAQARRDPHGVVGDALLRRVTHVP